MFMDPAVQEYQMKAQAGTSTNEDLWNMFKTYQTHDVTAYGDSYGNKAHQMQEFEWFIDQLRLGSGEGGGRLSMAEKAYLHNRLDQEPGFAGPVAPDPNNPDDNL